MDQYAGILASFPGLEKRLEEAGVQSWLAEQPKVEVEGEAYFVLGGDRLASESEAMLTFALEHRLLSQAEVQSAAGRQPLPPDVEAVDIDTAKGGN